MSSVNGIQQLSNDGLLPSSFNQSLLANASTSQLNQIAGSSIALQEVGSLLGFASASTDSASLSSTASNALLQEINPSVTTSSSTDPLTQAVNDELTASLNAASAKFLPQNSPATGSQINLLA
jgi:hypothetical protein